MTLETGDNWQSGTVDGYLGPGIGPSNSYPYSVQEARVASNNGTLNMLAGRFPVAFRGAGTITLPSISGGASTDYDVANIHLVATFNGSQGSPGTFAQAGTSLFVDTVGDNQYVVKVNADTPQFVAVSLYGMQLS